MIWWFQHHRNIGFVPSFSKTIGKKNTSRAFSHPIRYMINVYRKLVHRFLSWNARRSSRIRDIYFRFEHERGLWTVVIQFGKKGQQSTLNTFGSLISLKRLSYLHLFSMPVSQDAERFHMLVNILLIIFRARTLSVSTCSPNKPRWETHSSKGQGAKRLPHMPSLISRVTELSKNLTEMWKNRYIRKYFDNWVCGFIFWRLVWLVLFLVSLQRILLWFGDWTQ